MNPGGFIALHRGELTEALLRDGPAFRLLAHICLRARWRAGQSPEGLHEGEALLGADDVRRKLGLSRKEYRSALARLVDAGQVSVSINRGLGSVVRVAQACVFSMTVRKRADQRANQRANRFPSENRAQRADLGANSRATNEQVITRVQSPGGTEPEQKTKRERPGTGQTLSLFERFVSEVEAMPEFSGRADVREIARIVGEGNIRSAAHLARCVRNERTPRFNRTTDKRTVIPEPPGWREYALVKYPGAIFLDRNSDHYAEQWRRLAREHQEFLARDMAKHAA